MAGVRGWPVLVLGLLASPAEAQQPPRVCDPVEIGGRPTGVTCVDQALPAIGAGPKGPIVVWHEGQLGVASRLIATRIEADGTSSPDSQVVSSQVSPLAGPAVVPTPTGLLTVWAESKVVGAFLGEDGQRLGPTIEIFDHSDPRGVVGPRYGASASGSTVLVAAEVEGEIRVRRLRDDGTLLDDARSLGVGRAPAVASDQRGFIVAYTSSAGVVLAHLAEGEGGATARRHVGAGHSVVLTFAQGEYRAVWVDGEEHGLWSLAFPASSDLHANAPQLLLHSERPVDDPVLSPDGGRVVFVERETDNDQWNLFAVPFSAGAPPSRLTQSTDLASAPAMAAGPGGVTLVWRVVNYRSIAASQVLVAQLTDGLLTPRPIGGEACLRDPAIAAAPDGEVSVTWLDGREGGASYWTQVFGPELEPAGAAFGVVGPGIAYSRPVTARVGVRTAMAYVGSDNSDFGLFVATYERSSTAVTNVKLSAPAFTSFSLIAPPISATAGPSDLALISWRGIWGSKLAILGVLLGADGKVVAGPFAISENVVSSNWAGLAEAPVAAWNGSDWLVLWQDARVALEAPEIYGARVKTNGSVVDERLIVRADRPTALALSFGGPDYLLGWRSFSRPGGFATRLDLSGIPLDDPPLEVIELDGMGPVIVPTPEGYLFAWSAGVARAMVIEGAVVPTQPFAIAAKEGLSYDEVALAKVNDRTLIAVTERRPLGDSYRSSTIEARRILLDRGDCRAQSGADGCGCTTTEREGGSFAGYLLLAVGLLRRVGRRRAYSAPWSFAARGTATAASPKLRRWCRCRSLRR